jgi:hypothetical protein
MRARKIFKRIIFTVILILIIAFTWLSFSVFPAVSGYGSKNLCSAVYLQHRNPVDVIREDLGGFPLSLGTFIVNEKDSSVTGSVWGLAKRKTIYRIGIGCTVINDFTEEQIRNQQFELPAKPNINSDSISWPYGDKLPGTIPKNINKEKLDAAVNNVMNETTGDGKTVYTRAVLVIYDGNIITEKYAPGFDKNTVMLGWSMSKSLTGAMIGILVKENKLSVDAPAPVAAWVNTKKQ